MDAEALYSTLKSILPGLSAYCDNPAICFRVKSIPLRISGVFVYCGDYLTGNPSEVTDRQVEDLARFIDKCIVEGPAELSQPASDRFLELAARWSLGGLFAQYLSNTTRPLYDAAAAKWKATVIGRERFQAACVKTAHRMRQAGIDLLRQQDFEHEMVLRNVRLDQMMKGPSEKISLPRKLKAFFGKNGTELQFVSYDGFWVRFVKPLAGTVKTVVAVNREKLGGRGKAFGVELGVDDEGGYYAGVWLLRDIVEIAALPERAKKLYVWHYLTSEDLERVLHNVVALLRQVLPLFEQSVREEMLDKPTDM